MAAVADFGGRDPQPHLVTGTGQGDIQQPPVFLQTGVFMADPVGVRGRAVLGGRRA